MTINSNFLLFVFGLMSQVTFPQTSKNIKLKIQISEFPNSKGQCVVNLFVKDESFKKKPAHQQITKILDGKTEVEFDVPYGEYAIITWHDLNSNGDLDHNFLKIPTEPL